MTRAADLSTLPRAARVRLVAHRFWRGSGRGGRGLEILSRRATDGLFGGRDTRAVDTWQSQADAALSGMAAHPARRWRVLAATTGLAEVAGRPDGALVRGDAVRVTPIISDRLGEVSLGDHIGGAGEPSAASATAFSMAVSTPKLYHDETGVDLGFGSARQIARDLKELGCTFAWHPGVLQLKIGSLFVDDAGNAIDIPRVSDPSRMRSLVGSSPPLANLRDFLVALHEEGIELKLIITWLTLGGGEDPDASASDPVGEHAKGLPAQWDPAHWDPEEATLVADDGETYAFAEGEGPTLWHTSTMDPSNGYKLQYYRWMAQGLGQWLTTTRDELLSTANLDIADFIGGIEIGNELCDRHTTIVYAAEAGDDQVGDHQAWANFYYWCATGIWEHASWVPLWLPAMASYSVDARVTSQSWSGRFTVLSLLVDDVRDLCTANPFSYAPAPSIQDIVHGLDYHYYHHKVTTDYQPLSWILADLESLRRMVDSARGGELAGLPITVQEAGVNVVCDGAGAETPPGAVYDWGCELDVTRDDAVPEYPDYHNPLDDSGAKLAATQRPDREDCLVLPDLIRTESEPSGANDYQAVSLWCRLAAALAGGASVVGWHSHMSVRSGAFAGMGLRRDQHDTEVLDPTRAFQRPSYAAYRRFGTLLGDYGVVRRLSVPGASFPEPADTDIDIHALYMGMSWNDLDHLWVIEFSGRVTGSTVAPYAYLCFVDPDVSVSTACGVLTLRPYAPAWSAPAVQRRYLKPSGMATGASTSGYPTTLWWFPADRPVAPSDEGAAAPRYQVVVGQAQYPVLLTSSRRLVVDTAETA